MNHRFTLVAVALALFTFGCSEQADRDDHSDAAAHGTVGQDHSDHPDGSELSADAEVPAVKLDNGERWVANPETTSGIANMVAVIEKQAAAPADANVVKAELEDEFALIFERCTMTGEAHDQLHNYLIPIHQRLSGFDASDAAQLAEMKSYLATYGNYFK